MSAPDLSALVSARLCHDLISPIGAIGNGLELMQLADGASSAELELVSGSVDTALAKLRFFRVAFGPADSAARLSVDEARALTDAMFQGRLGVAWEAEGPDLARLTVQIICLAALCLEKSLPMGGSVRVRAADGDVALSVEGRRVAAPEALWAVAEGATPSAEELRSDGVQFALLARALAAAGLALETEFGATSAAIRMARVPAPA